MLKVIGCPSAYAIPLKARSDKYVASAVPVQAVCVTAMLQGGRDIIACVLKASTAALL